MCLLPSVFLILNLTELDVLHLNFWCCLCSEDSLMAVRFLCRWALGKGWYVCDSLAFSTGPGFPFMLCSSAFPVWHIKTSPSLWPSWSGLPVACSEAFNCSKGGQGRPPHPTPFSGSRTPVFGTPPHSEASNPAPAAGRGSQWLRLPPPKRVAGRACSAGAALPRLLPRPGGLRGGLHHFRGRGARRKRGRVLPERLLRLQHRGAGQRPESGGSAALSGGRGRAVRCGAVRAGPQPGWPRGWAAAGCSSSWRSRCRCCRCWRAGLTASRSPRAEVSLFANPLSPRWGKFCGVSVEESRNFPLACLKAVRS